MILLVPSDPMRPRRADPHFAAEARAAREAGLAVGLVDHDALAGAGDPSGVADVVADVVAAVPAADDAVYRGWMLRSERYDLFAAGLSARGVRLRTGSEQYRRAHELPGWYPALAEVTPPSVWTVGDAREDFETALGALGEGAAVLRDWTKSMKHYWHEAAYVPDVRDVDAAWRVARRFLELRDDDFVGGLVLRRFERFAGQEVRTWWVGGRCALVGPHPDTLEAGPEAGPDPGREPTAAGLAPFAAELAPLVAGLGLPFVTVDLALRDDGVWRVVELGDGQVSDRPAGLEPERLLAALAGPVESGPCRS